MGARLRRVGPEAVFGHGQLQFPQQQKESQEMPRTSLRGSATQ